MGAEKADQNLKANWDVETISCQSKLLIIGGKSGFLIELSLSSMTVAQNKRACRGINQSKPSRYEIHG